MPLSHLLRLNLFLRGKKIKCVFVYKGLAKLLHGEDSQSHHMKKECFVYLTGSPSEWKHLFFTYWGDFGEGL